jgi:hypothetical protein
VVQFRQFFHRPHRIRFLHVHERTPFFDLTPKSD